MIESSTSPLAFEDRQRLARRTRLQISRTACLRPRRKRNNQRRHPSHLRTENPDDSRVKKSQLFSSETPEPAVKNRWLFSLIFTLLAARQQTPKIPSTAKMSRSEERRVGKECKYGWWEWN